MSEPFPQTRAVIEQGIAQGLHLGAQIYVSRDGHVQINHAFGESRPGVAMTSETINLWMSSGKPLTAVAIAQLFERRLLDWDDRVAKFIPEFGVRGKEPITIRHLLTHTGGFRTVMGLEWRDTLDEAIAKICQAPLEPRWVPGETAGYHPASSWNVLAEIVRRLDGRDLGQYVREAIFAPAGMEDCWLGMPPEEYRKYGDRIGMMYATKSRPPQLAENGNSEADAAAIRPGANARGPISQLGKFYESLMKDVGILRKTTVDLMIERHRAGKFDQTFKHIIDFGFGFLLNSNQYGPETVPYGYGLGASPQTFGHSGQESSCGFCDPQRKLAVAWICNGMPGGAAHALRQRQINNAIWHDLGDRKTVD